MDEITQPKSESTRALETDSQPEKRRGVSLSEFPLLAEWIMRPGSEELIQFIEQIQAELPIRIESFYSKAKILTEIRNYVPETSQSQDSPPQIFALEPFMRRLADAQRRGPVTPAEMEELNVWFEKSVPDFTRGWGEKKFVKPTFRQLVSSTLRGRPDTESPRDRERRQDQYTSLLLDSFLTFRNEIVTNMKGSSWSETDALIKSPDTESEFKLASALQRSKENLILQRTRFKEFLAKFDFLFQEPMVQSELSQKMRWHLKDLDRQLQQQERYLEERIDAHAKELTLSFKRWIDGAAIEFSGKLKNLRGIYQRSAQQWGFMSNSVLAFEPQEVTDQVRGVVDAIELLEPQVRNLFSEMLRIFKAQGIAVERINEAAESLAHSDRLAWHSAPENVMVNEILRTGSVDSRIEQERKRGKSNFTTGQQKHEKQEYQSVYVQADNPYRVMMRHVDGESRYIVASPVSLVFSLSELLTSHQFLEADGLNLLPQEYQSRKDTKGTSLKLTDRPHVCVVHTTSADTLRASLVQQEPAWLEEVGGLEAWWNKHVIVIDPDTSLYEVNRMCKDKITFPEPINDPVMIPRGHSADTASESEALTVSLLSRAEVGRLRQSEENREQAVASGIQELLTKQSWSTEDIRTIIEILRQDPVLIEAVDLSVGVHEGYTLGEHLKMVLSQFERYINSNSEDTIFLRRFLLLHDMGKPEAVQRTQSNLDQHAYTERYLQEYWKRFGGNDAELKIAQSLLHNDFLGEYMKGRRDVGDTVKRITVEAEKVGISLERYFSLLQSYYLADASSYTLTAGQSFPEINAKVGLDDLFDFSTGSLSFSTTKTRGYNPTETFRELQNMIQLNASVAV